MCFPKISLWRNNPQPPQQTDYDSAKKLLQKRQGLRSQFCSWYQSIVYGIGIGCNKVAYTTNVSDLLE